ncbi:extracellular solute-binding protein [Jonesiaceae bacterium BS-20]|uniref:Extracellular solute-binding protein n=1 Tax=Jonesiaceae bacterium BS-20 TaxID=3120821 RepID=A0AAU7DVX4_9MICO
MKITRLAAVGAIAALALAGCSTNGSTQEPKPTDSSATSETPEEPAANTELTVWLAGETDTPEPAVEWLTKAAADQLQVDLKVERIGWGDLVPKVTTSIGDASTTPDIVELGNTQVQAFTHAGAFTDITALWDSIGGKGLSLQGMVDGGSVEGTLYAAPYYAGSRVVFYNEDLVAADQLPKTLGDLTALAEKLNTDDVSGFYIGGQDWRNGISWIFANGGQIATFEDGKWVGQLSSENSLKGLTEFQTLLATGTNAPKDGTDADLWVPFNEGKAAMFMAPGWAAGLIEADFKWSAFPLPGVDGGVAPVFLGGSNIGISAASANQEKAAEVLKLMLSKDYQLILAEAGLSTIYPEHEELAKGDPVKEASAAAAADGIIPVPSAKWAAFEESKQLEELFYEIASGGDVKEIAAKYDVILNEQLN